MTEFAGNYQGPLYAPHPDLLAERKQKEKEEQDGLNNTSIENNNEGKT